MGKDLSGYRILWRNITCFHIQNWLNLIYGMDNACGSAFVSYYVFCLCIPFKIVHFSVSKFSPQQLANEWGNIKYKFCRSPNIPFLNKRMHHVSFGSRQLYFPVISSRSIIDSVVKLLEIFNRSISKKTSSRFPCNRSFCTCKRKSSWQKGNRLCYLFLKPYFFRS